MIKASVLYYTLIFSLVLGVSITMLMTLFMNFDIINSRINNTKDFLLNIQSGIEVVSNYPNEFPLNTEVEIDLFSDGEDSLRILRRMHGALNIVSVLAHRNGQYQKASVQMGWKSEDIPISLHLADNAFSVSVCGETRIEGKAFLPGRPIKRAYIEGKNYTGSQLIYGTVSTSKRMVPSLQENLYSNIMNQLRVSYLHDSLVQLEALDLERNSFLAERWVIKSEQFLRLDNRSFSGNMTIISSKGIEIRSNTRFKDVVFIAPVIRIGDGVQGEFQCIATDSLLVGENVKLNYPSNLMLLEKVDEKGKLFQVGENSMVEGSVCIIPSERVVEYSPGASLVLKKNIKVTGVIYSPYRVSVSSGIEIAGSFYCKEAELKTPSAVYSNHFLDFKVVPSKLDEFYVQTFQYPNYMSNELIKWLN